MIMSRVDVKVGGELAILGTPPSFSCPFYMSNEGGTRE